MRILVADISGTDYVRPPIAEFLGIKHGTPPPEGLVWRGHEVLIRPGISIEEAMRIRPDFIFALMGWHGIAPPRTEFYEYFFDRGIPIFTWGNDSFIPRLMVETRSSNAVSRRIIISKPDHPIMWGVKAEDIKTSGSDWRRLVLSIKGDIGLAYDPDNASWEVIYLEEWFGNHRWLHYHPHPCPPDRLIENFLTYMTRPKNRTISMITSLMSGLALGSITRLITKRMDYSIGAGLIGTVIGAVVGYRLSE